MGGSDPYLVLADADLELVADACFAGRLLNAGQSCISPKRLLVHASVLPGLTERLVARCQDTEFAAEDAKLDKLGQLAPMARADLRDQLHEQVRNSVLGGATLCCGGELPQRRGYYYPATVLSNVRPGQAAFDEELFGPVFALSSFTAVDEAIRLANQSRYGLGAGVFSRDVVRAEQVASMLLHAGTVAVNDVVRSEPGLPFGGIGESGYGRELGLAGMRAFCNLKTVVVAR